MKNNNEAPGNLEAVLEAARKLMLRGKGAEACRVLEEATERAVSDGEPEDAAIFANIRGSYFVALGQDEGALNAFLEAEELSRAEKNYFRLTTAKHLVSGLNQPQMALEKIDSVLGDHPADPALYQQAHAIRGLALLDLEQPEAAVNELETLCTDFSADLPALSLDLSLVEELLNRQIGAGASKRYLTLVESSAKESEEAGILDKISELKRLFR